MDTYVAKGTTANNEHRKKFNLAAFGTTFEPTEIPVNDTKQRRKVVTKNRYDEIVKRIRYWDVTEGHTDPVTGVHVTQKELRKSCEPSWFNEKLRYRIHPVTMNSNDEPVEHLQYYVSRQEVWRVVVHQEMVFDAIHACHVAARHKKAFVTKKLASTMYYNLTEDLCRIFIESCPVCNSNSSDMIVRPLAFAENDFREKYTACVVDYSTVPVTIVQGVTMRYVLALQDDATKFTVLRPIGNKDAVWLEYELSLMFGMLGYPKKIFKSGDDAGLRSALVKKIIQDCEPDCDNECGDVGHIVLQVKNVISDLEANEEGGENWVSLLPKAMAAINKSSYPKVFGMKFLSSEIDHDQEMAVNATGYDDIKLALEDSKCQFIRVQNTPYRIVYPQLRCARCDNKSILSVAEDSYYDCFVDEPICWTADMIATFGILKSHDSYSKTTIFVDSGTPTRKEYQQTTSVQNLNISFDTILTVACKDSHFVVLQIKLEPHCVTVVYDGKSTKKKNEKKDLKQWEEHEEYILSRYGISKTNSKVKWYMRHYDFMQDFASRPLRIEQKD